MLHLSIAQEQNKKVYRIAVSCLFFLQGLCFATWASRIPDIQATLRLSDAQLGLVLFALPCGSMISLPLSGWVINRFGSKYVGALSLLLYAISLTALGFASSIALLITGLVLFGIFGNIANIAINTQAVGVEARYNRNIMASFHGLWSLAGFTAAGLGSVLIGHDIGPLFHFISIAVFIVLGVIVCLQYLIGNEQKSTAQNKLFVRPDERLLKLGTIAFCCMICEGTMFDWSGIYFQKVVEADKAWVGAGYTAFMSTMALGRFVADWVVGKIGFKKTIQWSGIIISTGLAIAIAFPYLVTAITGFFLVGFGVSSVIPLIYSEAGKTTTVNAGYALAAVTSIGFLGFLLGPPMIGLIASAFSLRVSFVVVALMGLIIVLLVQRVKSSSVQ